MNKQINKWFSVKKIQQLKNKKFPKLKTIQMGTACCQNQQGVHVQFQSVTYIIKLEPNSTMRQLKGNIERQTSIPARDIVLFFRGNKIHDLDTLQSLAFSVNSDNLVMQKAALEGPEISITVRSINFNEEIQINPNETVGELKRRIEQKRKLPVSKQRLISGGKILIDKESLSSQGITNRSTIHCTIPLVP